jgi:hypothetical protein
VVTGTEEIERDEWSCKINGLFLSDIESFVEFE